METDWEKYKKLEYNDFNSFKKKHYKDGVMTLKIVSWDEFHNVRQIFTDQGVDEYYFWRGQRCYCDEWLLKSSFDRAYRYPNNGKRENHLDEILHEFKSCLRDIKPEHDRLDIDYIWAIAQHYGLPTPLLDWTKCPYTAAFNAFFREAKNWQTEYRVVYVLNWASRLLLKKPSRERFIEILDFTKTLTPNKNARLKIQKNPDAKQLNARLEIQRGMFTKALDGIDIKSNVERLSRLENTITDKQKIILAEILMPDKERDNCLEFLKKEKQITYGKLYPDYQGAVEICKIKLGIK